MPLAMAQWAAWVKSATEQMSRLPPGPQFAEAQAVQGGVGGEESGLGAGEAVAFFHLDRHLQQRRRFKWGRRQ
jgi:hypothetical protein